MHAQTFRRSTAGQIEYWLTLGKSMESEGLTAQQAKAVVEAHDQKIFGKALIAKFIAHSESGQLAAGIQTVLEENKQKAIALANTSANDVYVSPLHSSMPICTNQRTFSTCKTPKFAR
jgi:hypothetical protein